MRVGRSTARGPSLFWQSHWDRHYELWFNVALVQGSEHTILVNTGPPADLEPLERHWRARRQQGQQDDIDEAHAPVPNDSDPSRDYTERDKERDDDARRFVRTDDDLILSRLQSVGISPEGTAIAPLPVPDGEELAWSPMNAGFAFAISSTAENREAAAIVLNELAGSDMQTTLAERGIPPLLESAWEAAAIDQPLLEELRPTELDQQWPKSPAALLAPEGLNMADLTPRLLLEPNIDIGAELADFDQRYTAAYEEAAASGDIDPAEYGG